MTDSLKWLSKEARPATNVAEVPHVAFPRLDGSRSVNEPPKGQGAPHLRAPSSRLVSETNSH